MSPSVVLIVEDDFLVRQSAVFLLKEAGFDTLEAGNADEAVPLLEARQDIKVVTDINMPGSMDGLELAQAIRHRWPTVELVLSSRAWSCPCRGEGYPQQWISTLPRPQAARER